MIVKVLGKLSDCAMCKIDNCLKDALGIICGEN